MLDKMSHKVSTILSLFIDDLLWRFICFLFFFFNDTATTEIYTLSLHDALPISFFRLSVAEKTQNQVYRVLKFSTGTRLVKVAIFSLKTFGLRFCLKSSQRLILGRSEEHTSELQSPVPISYAVFCLKKKKKTIHIHTHTPQNHANTQLPIPTTP